MLFCTVILISRNYSVHISVTFPRIYRSLWQYRWSSVHLKWSRGRTLFIAHLTYWGTLGQCGSTQALPTAITITRKYSVHSSVTFPNLSVTVTVEVLFPTAIMITRKYSVHSSVTFPRNDPSLWQYRCLSVHLSWSLEIPRLYLSDLPEEISVTVGVQRPFPTAILIIRKTLFIAQWPSRETIGHCGSTDVLPYSYHAH
jgi:hypothetical protein